MSLKKQYAKNKQTCKVTFKLSKIMTKAAENVHLVGEFNGWNMSANPMKKNKDGSFSTTVSLPVGREYQFRYLLDWNTWENDDCADKYVPSPYGDSDNSVVTV